MLSKTSQQRLAWALIMIGVLAWVPYFYRLAAGEAPNFLPYLAVHLAGVLSGGWLRRRSSSVQEVSRGRRRQKVAVVLVVLGVLAWVPYFYLNEVAGQQQPLAPYLAAHLTGVLGGSALRLSLIVEQRLRGRDPESDKPRDER